jgi:hypothetical protein
MNFRMRAAIIALGSMTGAAHACSPVHIGTLQEESDRSGLIMVVQIMEVAFRPERDNSDPDLPRYAAKFRVVETLKGNPDEVTQLSGGDGGDCGLLLVAGGYVLVLADQPEPVVRVAEFRSSSLRGGAPDSTWSIDNARIQALRNYVGTGKPIDDCLNWTSYMPWKAERDPEEFERCKAVISSVLKLSESR